MVEEVFTLDMGGGKKDNNAHSMGRMNSAPEMTDGSYNHVRVNRATSFPDAWMGRRVSDTGTSPCNGTKPTTPTKRNSLKAIKLRMQGSIKCMFPRLRSRSMTGISDRDGDDDDIPADVWTRRFSRTSVDSSEGDDMSICYPLDPVDAGIFRKPAVYGGRRSVEDDTREEINHNATEVTKPKLRKSFLKLSRFMSIEEDTMTFAEYLQASDDIRGLELHLEKLERAKAVHVVNQRLNAKVDESINSGLPYKLFNPLGYAVLQNEPKLVELLLKHDADTSYKPCVLDLDGDSVHAVPDPESALHLAALFGCVPQILLDLIEYGGSLEEESITVQTDLLRYSASCTDRVTVQKILDKIDDVSIVCNQMDTTALHLAVECKNIVTIEELLRRNAFVNCRDRTYKSPLMVACYQKVHGDYKIVETLLKYGADINMRDMFGRTPLHYAIRHSKADTVKLLLDAGADLRAKDCRGHTMLFYIFAKVSKGFFRRTTKEVPGKLLSLLIEASCGNFVLDYQQDFINTIAALLETCCTKEETIIQILESNTHHIKSKDCSHSQRVLHLAVKQQHMKTLTWFLEYGLNVHLQDADGWKAIHHAITTGSQGLVELLLKYKANIEDATCNGITPLWLMIRYNLQDMAAHFINDGCCSVTSSVKLRFIYHIPCDCPRLPKELFDPDEQRSNPRAQARKAQRKISMLEFSVHMGAYHVASLILHKLKSSAAGAADAAKVISSTQDVVNNKLELLLQEEESASKARNIQLLQDLQEKLSDSEI